MRGSFPGGVVEGKDVFALVVGWALSGKQSGMGGVLSWEPKKCQSPLKPPGRILDDSASDPESGEHSLRQRLVCPTFAGESNPRQQCGSR